MTKKLTAAERLKRLTEKPKSVAVKTTAPQTEHGEKPKSKHKGNYVLKGGNGGARPNSGPDPLPPELQRKTLKQAWREFGLGEVPVRLEKGTVNERMEKMARLKVIQEATFQAASKQNVPAIKEFNDRVFGKAPQPIIGDDDEPPVQVDVNQARTLQKIYGRKPTDKRGA